MQPYRSCSPANFTVYRHARVDEPQAVGGHKAFECASLVELCAVWQLTAATSPANAWLSVNDCYFGSSPCLADRMPPNHVHDPTRTLATMFQLWCLTLLFWLIFSTMTTQSLSSPNGDSMPCSCSQKRRKQHQQHGAEQQAVHMSAPATCSKCCKHCPAGFTRMLCDGHT